MILKIIFKKITFNNIDANDFNKVIKKKSLFVFPSGPAIADIYKSKKYYLSLQHADFVFFDSGFLLYCLKFLKILMSINSQVINF